ncbi:hypothetical protein CMI47_19395 [Candidatus Pacearchaeota archaeon]|nr:hypothetical protein [Candidatus Pacearchaeota archaeon]|tara:strand:+ start:2240 stop:2596 length:357 start_codon:yes stop_codon:yes gene_type:complete
MSYSRWSNSFWYTFWSGTDDAPLDAKFEICDVARGQIFTYKELSEDIDSCLRLVQESFRKKAHGKLLAGMTRASEGNLRMEYEDVEWDPVELSDEQLSELRGYMTEFMRDVEERYDIG